MAPCTFEWLGTGSGLNFELGNTSFLVYSEGPTLLLVDCGTTAPSRLAELGKLDSVTDVVVTHSHADHIGGLEALGFYHRFVKPSSGGHRPRLHLATNTLAHDLWEYSLRGGMGKLQGSDSLQKQANLDTYFEVIVGSTIELPGLPHAHLFPTPHVKGMENYGLRFDNGVYYSGDTLALPPSDPEIIFQDCQFHDGGHGDVHISYGRLARELSAAVKSKTHLVHLGHQYASIDPRADGFAGFIMPGQRFLL